MCMNVLIVLAHPEPKSFNAAMAASARATFAARGHAVSMLDLYALDFDPRYSRANFTSVKDPDYFYPQIEEVHATEVDGFSSALEIHMRKLEACDLMIWQFPLWWFGLPGILKGWVDRVFAMGRFYGGSRKYKTGLKHGKRALLSLTTGGPRAAYEKDGSNGDIDAILRPIQRGMLEFVGFDVLRPNIVFGPIRLSVEERADALVAWRARLAALESEVPVDVGRY
jgi:NAD(P)H dehydrogenase (quinone)